MNRIALISHRAAGRRAAPALAAGGLALAAVACGLAAGSSGCAPAGREPAPAAILVTLDTFRADHLGAAGHPQARTPHLDRLARGGLHWPDAVTGIPLTTPSHATILTGRSPRSHGLVKNRMRLASSIPTLAGRLAAAGVRTGAVVSSDVVLGPEMGLDRGFDSYEVVRPESHPASGEGAETTHRAAAWLARHGGPGSFLWVHYFDAHLPYLPPDPWARLHDPGYAGPWHRTQDSVQRIFREDPGDAYNEADVRHLAALYLGEIGFLDRCVGGLVRAAEARETARGSRLATGRPDDPGAGRGGGTVFLVTADHGEGLWEHERYFGHDLLLYDTSLRVPLLLAGGKAGAEAGAGGRLVDEPARTRDVAPTLLGLFGLDPDPGMEGRDLRDEPPPTGDDRLFVAESHPSREKAPSIYAMRTPSQKVVWKPRERRHEAYDLAADPGETRDLWGSEGAWSVLAEDLALDLRNRPVGSSRTIDDEAGGLEGSTREALRSLGYVD